MFIPLIIVTKLTLVLIVSNAITTADFKEIALEKGVDANVLEGICRYESDNGRILTHQNKDGSWDVGYCMLHFREKTAEAPKVPTHRESIAAAATELIYWKKMHKLFCIRQVAKNNKCGYTKYKKWRSIKNCKRNHAWFGHYNWGFRTAQDGYDKRVQCLINNGFKKCKKKRWKTIRF